TANAMHGAGIAILYATLFSMHVLWHLVPAAVAFIGMLFVTAAAVYLSTRRESVFIALLGLIGGFATPALLSSGENRPLALFSYLLLLNGGISWIAYRKRWPLLTALSFALTAFYQWAWVHQFLTKGQMPLAAGIFAVFALVAIVFAVTWRKGQLLIAATAVALSSIALMTIAPPTPLLLASHTALFVAILVIAALTEHHILAVLAIPFYVAMLITSKTSGPNEQLLFAFVPFALFVAYAFHKRQSHLASLDACLDSAPFFFPAWDALEDLGFQDVIGLLPLAPAPVLVPL